MCSPPLALTPPMSRHRRGGGCYGLSHVTKRVLEEREVHASRLVKGFVRFYCQHTMFKLAKKGWRRLNAGVNQWHLGAGYTLTNVGWAIGGMGIGWSWFPWVIIIG